MNSVLRKASVVLFEFAVIGILAGGATQSLAGPVYNAAAEFNGSQGGTSGVWNYGRLDGAGGTFTPATSFVGVNFVGPGGGAYLLVGSDFMHPGCDPAATTGTCVNNMAFADLRFTAPTAGSYTATFFVRLSDPLNNPINCEYRGCDPAINNGYPDYRRDGVRMWLGTDFIDLSTWQGQAAVTAAFAGQTLTRTFTLSAGGVIDFAVDHNGARLCTTCTPTTRFNLYDSTRYTASVTKNEAAVPAPASIALLGVGLIGFGLSLSKRRRRPLAAA
jgi:hypothetical protein